MAARGGSTIEPPQHFETIAEVAAAFTGFAGLVSILGRSSLDPTVRLWRVQVMIVTSLAAMFGALTPVTVSMVDASPDSFWRISSFVLLVLVVGQLAFVFRAMPPEQGSGPFRLIYGFIPFLLTAGSLVIQVGLLAVVAGVAVAAAPLLYSLSLGFLLVASSFHFLRLVRAALPEA